MLYFSASVAEEKDIASIGGRIQVDYDKTELNNQSVNDEWDIRRAWLHLNVNWQDLKYVVMLDVDDSPYSDKSLTFNYLKYSGFGEQLIVTLGRNKTPLGMNWLTSNTKLNIAERGGVMELHSYGRADGLTLSGSLSNHINYSAGIYHSDDFSGPIKIARLTRAIWLDDSEYIHLGAAFGFSSDSDRRGLELAYGRDRFHFQSEYFQTKDKVNNTELDGYYLELGYFLTENARTYENGKFAGLSDTGRYGSFQLVARFESGDGDFSDFALGVTSADAYVVGINWYLSTKSQVMLSYAKAQDDQLPANKADEIRLRVQYLF